jgi:hypothetical protein
VTPEQVVDLQLAMSRYDSRNLDEDTSAFYYRQLAAIDYPDALEAVHAHYADETRRMMPADVKRLVRRARAERTRLTAPPAPACDPDDVGEYLRQLRAGERAIGDGRWHPPLPTPTQRALAGPERLALPAGAEAAS